MLTAFVEVCILQARSEASFNLGLRPFAFARTFCREGNSLVVNRLYAGLRVSHINKTAISNITPFSTFKSKCNSLDLEHLYAGLLFSAVATLACNLQNTVTHT
jgi:hypothetical protein